MALFPDFPLVFCSHFSCFPTKINFLQGGTVKNLLFSLPWEIGEGGRSCPGRKLICPPLIIAPRCKPGTESGQFPQGGGFRYPRRGKMRSGGAVVNPRRKGSHASHQRVFHTHTFNSHMARKKSGQILTKIAIFLVKSWGSPSHPHPAPHTRFHR